LLVDLLPIVQRTPLTSALAAARSSASADQQANRKGDQPGPNRFHFAFLFTPPLARWPPPAWRTTLVQPIQARSGASRQG
jgi:hypothetical protein